MASDKPTVNVNGIAYRWPQRPVVVVCIDGGDPAYLRRFLDDGAMPNIARFIAQGFGTVADGSMPSFTCPNNMSIITGTPTSKHGISGNFYLDTATWQPVVMTGPELLRGDTILQAVCRCRRQGDLDHRQGQAAQAARQGPRRVEGPRVVLVANSRAAARWPTTASRTCSSSSACRSPTCTRWSCRCSCSRPASSCSRSGGPTCCTCR